MKVGLVRHFKVMKAFPERSWLSPEEMAQWFREYDATEVELGQSDLGGIEWNCCYSSDLPRAVTTARSIYDGDITLMKELREIPYPEFTQMINRPLPFMLWAVMVRAAWFVNHKSLAESKPDVIHRIQSALDAILETNTGENVLIVSHGALMMTMRKELTRRGFKGPSIRTPENGKLYLFEK